MEVNQIVKWGILGVGCGFLGSAYSALYGSDKVQAAYGKRTHFLEINAGKSYFQREIVRDKFYTSDYSALSLVAMACLSVYRKAVGSKAEQVINLSETVQETVQCTVFKEDAELADIRETRSVSSSLYQGKVSEFFLLYMAGCSLYNQIFFTKEKPFLSVEAPKQPDALDQKIESVLQKLKEIEQSGGQLVKQKLVEIGIAIQE
jgi:hypothetical protein